MCWSAFGLCVGCFGVSVFGVFTSEVCLCCVAFVFLRLSVVCVVLSFLSRPVSVLGFCVFCTCLGGCVRGRLLCLWAFVLLGW